jgi:hypothetical protein
MNADPANMRPMTPPANVIAQPLHLPADARRREPIGIGCRDVISAVAELRRERVLSDALSAAQGTVNVVH